MGFDILLRYLPGFSPEDFIRPCLTLGNIRTYYIYIYIYICVCVEGVYICTCIYINIYIYIYMYMCRSFNKFPDFFCRGI